MKKRYIITGILLLFAGLAWVSQTQWAKDFVKKEDAREAAEAKAHSDPPSAKAKLINTQWQSPDVGYNGDSDHPNVVVLSFYADSVTFSLRYGSIIDAAWLLGGRPFGKKTYYSWDYSVEGNKIVLDPGIMGFAVPMEISGDSLIWNGKMASQFDYLSFKKIK